MFSSKLKRPALALAVTAGLLAVAGPAGAATTHAPSGPTALAGDLLNDLEGLPARVNSAGADSAPKARSAVLPELDANANAFRPEINDEVLVALQYEPDYIEGTQFVD